MPKILVIGGTGMLGRPVTFQLLHDKYDLRLFTTNADKAQQIFDDRLEYATGDVSDIDSLKKAMEGYDQIYINLKGGPSKEDYVRVEEIGSKNIYAAAKEAGVNKIVQISGANVCDKLSGFDFIKVKLEAEKALIASGLIYTILKPSWFCESLPLFMQKAKAVYIGKGSTSFHFLAAADYATVVSKCFASSQADNKILTIFGPEAMPISEALRRFVSVVHPDVSIDRLPIWLAKFSATLSFNKTLKAAVNLMAFFDKYDDSDIDVEPDEADKLFGRCPTTIEEWSRAYRKVIKGV